MFPIVEGREERLRLRDKIFELVGRRGEGLANAVPASVLAQELGYDPTFGWIVVRLVLESVVDRYSAQVLGVSRGSVFLCTSLQDLQEAYKSYSAEAAVNEEAAKVVRSQFRKGG